MHASIVIGAGSTIGNAVAGTLRARGGPVWAISRPGGTGDNATGADFLECDYSEQGMADCVRTLQQHECIPERVGIFLGVLHDEALQPEKRIEDLTPDALRRVFEINAGLPVLWLKHLLPLLAQGQDCRVAVLSARVGSIGDNRLGGWYAYRASKAALNMLLQTAAVEYARRAPQVKLVAFHPGTTNSPLSRPFQSRVPQGKLFEPGFVAGRLLDVLDELAPDGMLSYVDYDGRPIPW